MEHAMKQHGRIAWFGTFAVILGTLVLIGTLTAEAHASGRHAPDAPRRTASVQPATFGALAPSAIYTDVYEPNDSQIQAANVGSYNRVACPGVTIVNGATFYQVGSSNPATDHDWYRVQLGAMLYYTLTIVQQIPSDLHFNVLLLDPSNTSIATMSGLTSPVISFYSGNGGSFVFKLTAANSAVITDTEDKPYAVQLCSAALSPRAHLPLVGNMYAAPLPLVGPHGQLHVDQNPVPYSGTVTAYWNVTGISGIWFDKGDSTGFQPAAGVQVVPVLNITATRTLRLMWQMIGGQVVTDTLQVEVTPAGECSPSDPNWRGPWYPFCVAQDLRYTDGGGLVRYFGYQQDYTLTAQWDVYGIRGLWLKVDPNITMCGPGGSSGFNVAVPGNGSYSWNVKDLARGGYIVHLKIQRNDGQFVYYGEKYLCVGMD
jgi:hypothetical protein